MKIVILNNCVPFLKGGAEYLADALVRRLNEFGHEAILFRIPFRWDPPETIVENMLACRLMRLPNADRVIGFKFPAYFVPHHNKVLWLLHQFRQAYDLQGTEHQFLSDDQYGREIRDTIVRADNAFLPEAKKIYTNSGVTSERLRTFNGLSSEVLYPPLLDPGRFVPTDYGDYIFAGGRVNASKRQRLLVESMQYVKTPVRLVVAGSAEASEADLIEKLLDRGGMRSKVVFMNRYIAEDEKIELVNGALACAYIPLDEDSYGYVSLEACTARKAVVTCTDSGGIQILVKDGATGYVANPDSRDIARCFDELYSDRSRTIRMGEGAHEIVKTLKIDWEHVVKVLTA